MFNKDRFNWNVSKVDPTNTIRITPYRGWTSIAVPLDSTSVNINKALIYHNSSKKKWEFVGTKIKIFKLLSYLGYWIYAYENCNLTVEGNNWTIKEKDIYFVWDLIEKVLPQRTERCTLHNKPFYLNRTEATPLLQPLRGNSIQVINKH